ncbi:tryptophan-rich sensory protein [Spongiimicrobium salis]|uniref:tryptophan-rich sensory protein n=1 Tax=Spongiimicrobium salis TaxID=1667022 RepID=UPI00374DE81A
MTILFNKPNRQSLIFNLLLVVGGVILINGLIFSLEWSTRSPEKIVETPSFTPPGWVVGLVWTIWFTFLAISRWIIGKSENYKLNSNLVLIDILIISCLCYPFYSLAIGSVIGGFIGNVFAIFLSSYVFFRVLKKSKTAAWLIFPIIPWVTFATIITLFEVGII